MDSEHNSYYYQLGRHMAAIERDNRITKTRPDKITAQQFRDWLQGYNEMVAMFDWRRTSIKDQARVELKERVPNMFK